MTLAVKSQWWASPKDGDHARLAATLEALGMHEYLPSTVNSQKISGYVRDYIDDVNGLKVGGDDGLDPQLAEVLKVSERVSISCTQS
jgi:hypothetical protein